MTAPARPILRWHGGKWRLGPWILAQMPPHRVYVEPYGGAGSVLMQKAPAIDVINDLNGEVTNVFRVLRDPQAARRLEELLRATPYSRAEFEAAYEPAADPVEQARRTLVRGHQAHGSTGACGGARAGGRMGIRDRGPSTAREWAEIWSHVGSWVDRLRGVFVEERPALEVIRGWDAADALFYVDPPYVLSTRTHGCAGRAYAYEMDDADHEALAQVLHGVRGMAMISGYHSALYDRLYGDWQRTERQTVADHQAVRTEVLWSNAAAVAARAQGQEAIW